MFVLVFLIILAILVLVHELGHFIAAKKSGVLVEEFGIGFPPRLFAFKYKETLYSLNLIPLGGFVKVYGEEYKEKIDLKLKNKAFSQKKPYLKALIIVAGVVGNFILGWTIISYLFTQGIPTPTDKVMIEKIQAQTPADIAGLRVNDLILTMQKNQGQTLSIKSTADLINTTKNFAGEPVTFFIQRGGKKLSVIMTPRKNPPPGEGPLGVIIAQKYEERKYPWYKAPFYGLIEVVKITGKIVSEFARTIFQLVTLQKTRVEVAGPVGIARYTGEAIKFGGKAVLEFMALLSLNLAVINILPFPALDGGRLVFVLYEWVSKKRINQNLEKYLNLAGIFILLTLAVIITINDIVKIYK